MLDVEFLTKVLHKVYDGENISPERAAKDILPYLEKCGGCGARVDHDCKRVASRCYRAFHGGKFEKKEF